MTPSQQRERLLEETNASGVAQADYIYLNGRPVAVLSGSTLYYLHSDRLGTPQVATDSNQAVAWQASYDSFGQASVSGTITQNLRLPGQYFDVQSGWNHNGFRDYAPQLGRYIEPDPIGLAGGINEYAYVGDDPIDWSDPFGLRALTDCEKQKLSPYIPKVDLDNANLHDGKVPWWLGKDYESITLKNDIYFRPGIYDPSTIDGLATLGHELVHVGQYRNGMTRASYLWSTRHGYDNSPYEKQAYAEEDKIKNGLSGNCGCSK
jgi:RHS repeat-associated protein